MFDCVKAKKTNYHPISTINEGKEILDGEWLGGRLILNFRSFELGVLYRNLLERPSRASRGLGFGSMSFCLATIDLPLKDLRSIFAK